MTRIVLNLDTSFQGDSQSKDEIWQQSAANKLCEYLCSAGKKASTYRATRKDASDYIATEHNAIFISGGRGAGKTVFLKNAKQIWEKSPQTKSEINLHFTPEVDPTLLVDHDDFTHIIVASLFNQVEGSLRKCSESQKAAYYSSLKNLSNALWSQDGFSDSFGIDRIQKYRSGIQIESLFHAYVEQCIDILGCQAIVMPIDDVDMGLDRAFEVLDVVRRLLSCPYIIPLVSGDHSLYQHVSRLHFEDKTASKEATVESREQGKKIAKELSESYLIKLLPGHLRLPLTPIHELLPNLDIEADENKTSYQEYESSLINYFFTWCNGVERSTDWPKPRNARELVQFVSALPPEAFKGEKTNQNNWQLLQIWADQVSHGTAYTNAHTFLQLTAVQSPAIEIDFSKLLAFSPILQSRHTKSWVSKNFLTEQKEAMDRFPKPQRSNTTRKDVLVDNEPIVNSAFSEYQYVLRSMPPLEFHITNMAVSKNQRNSPVAPILELLYTHYEYYGRQDNRTHKVFFSRAFELVATSLLVLSGEVKLKGKSEWKEYLEELSKRPPFYSIHAVSPSKTMDDGSEEENLIDAAQGQSSKAIDQLADKMMDWLESYDEQIKTFQKGSMIPLISSVFNKVFTQLHLLRIEQINKPEHLAYRAKRFEYLVINALASFLKSGRVIKANLAIDTKSTTIWKYDKFKSSGTFRGNVVRWLENDDGKDSDQKILVEAVSRHPIFSGNVPQKNTVIPKPTISSIDSLKFIHDKIYPIIDNIKENLAITGKLKYDDIAKAIELNYDSAKKTYHKIDELLEAGQVSMDEQNPRTIRMRIYNALVDEFGSE